MRIWLAILMLVLGVSTYAVFHPAAPNASGSAVSSTSPGHVLGTRTKTWGCVVNDKLPDPECTPGAVIATATKDQICTPGYSKSVRNVPVSEKSSVYAEYGITSHQPGQYEVDHLVSLELGGSNDEANLWPEAANPAPGFHQKDSVENMLHDEVCAGSISLATAQQQISSNWMTVYSTLPH